MTPTQTMKNKPKVLFVITKSNWGGAQKYVYDLATELSKQNYDVVVALGGEGELVTRLKNADIPVIAIKHLKNNMNILTSMFMLHELYSIIKRESPHVVHLNSSKIGLFGGLASRMAHTPRIIFTGHSWPFNEERSALQKVFLRALMQTAVFLSHASICVSQKTKESLLAPKFIAQKCIVIHNGISPVAFKEAGSFFDDMSLPRPTRTTLFSIGELHKSKGYDLALNHLAHLKDLSWEWHIAGEGKERYALATQIKNLGLEDRVFLHGHIFGAPYIPSFDYFFLPSRTEGLAYVAIEALGSAVPIIASDAGGIPEVLGKDPGTTFINMRAKETTQKLREVISLPTQKIADGREELREEFSLKRMVEKTIGVYNV